MSELAISDSHLDSGNRAEAGLIAAASEVASMRDKVEALRDVLIALGLQLVFRATLLLRSWNQ